MKIKTSQSVMKEVERPSLTMRGSEDSSSHEPRRILAEILAEALFEILQTKPGLTHEKHPEHKQKAPK